MWSYLLSFHGGYQLAYQTDVRIIKHTGIRVAVHSGQMHDNITFTHKRTQFILALKIGVFKGDTQEFIRKQTELIVEMGTKPGWPVMPTRIIKSLSFLRMRKN